MSDMKMTRPSIILAGMLVAVLPAASASAQTAQARQTGKNSWVVQTPASAKVAARASNGFSVVLVLGDMEAAGSPGAPSATAAEALPASARKALADMKDFLPYRSYQLLDTQWSMGAGRIISRLRGVAGKEYDLQLITQPGSETFTRIRELAGQTPDQEPVTARPSAGNVVISRFLLAEATAMTPAAKDLEAQGVFLRRDNPAIIDTSFSMDVGETVVVGTSRLQPGKALIVLLTAVPRPGAARVSAAPTTP